MVDSTQPRTHTAFALKREGKRFGRWLEIGAGRLEKDGTAHVFLDRLPIGGFTGYVYLTPTGRPPPVSEPEPQRPAPTDDGEDLG